MKQSYCELEKTNLAERGKLEAATKERDEMAHRLEVAMREKEESICRFDATVVETFRLESELSDREKDLACVREEITLLKKEREMKGTEINRLHEELHTSSCEKEKAHTSLTELQEKLSHTMKERELMESEMEAIHKEKVGDKDREIEKLRGELETLCTEVSTMQHLQKELYETKLIIERMDQDNIRMNEAYTERESKAKERMTRQMQVKEDAYRVLEDKERHAVKCLADMQKEIMTIQKCKDSEISDLTATLAALESSKRQFQANQLALEQDVFKLKGQVVKLEETLEQKEAELHSLLLAGESSRSPPSVTETKESDSLRKEIASLKCTKSEMKLAMDEKDRELTRLRHSGEDQSHQINLLNQDVSNLSQLLHELESSMQVITSKHIIIQSSLQYLHIVIWFL